MSQYIMTTGDAAADAGAILGAGANIAAGQVSNSAQQQAALLLAQQQQSAIDPTTILLLAVVAGGIFMFTRSRK